MEGANWRSLATGLRLNEILSMRYGNISWENDNCIIKIPSTKNGHPHSIPLVGIAKELLTRLCTFFGRRLARRENSSVMNFKGMGVFTPSFEIHLAGESSSPRMSSKNVQSRD